MQVECDLTASVALSGNGDSGLDGGWLWPESEIACGIAAESHVICSRLKEADQYFPTLDVVRFIHDPELPAQTPSVSISSTIVGSSEVAHAPLLDYRIAANLVQRPDRVPVIGQHPDATRPKDFTESRDDHLMALAVSAAKLVASSTRCGFAATDHRPKTMLTPDRPMDECGSAPTSVLDGSRKSVAVDQAARTDGPP